MKILVSGLLVIFLEICYGAKTSYVEPKTPADDCGFDYGGPMIQQVTVPVLSPVNPHWSEKYQQIYVADQKDPSVYTYELKTGKLTTIKIYELNNQTFTLELSFRNNMIDYYTLREVGNVTNDEDLAVKQGRTDNDGRLFLDLIKLEGNKSSVVSSKGIFSQISFDNEFKKMLIVNDNSQQISLADFNAESGTIDEDSLSTVFDASNTQFQGKISDAIFDTLDNIWIAFNGSGTIVKYNYKSNKNEYEMTIPETSISGMCWGGADWDTLFVTTGQFENTFAHPAAGAVFAVTGLGATGVKYSDMI